MLLNLRSPLPPDEQNYTIVVNWKQRGFGCAKVCFYCNWRDSPMLPHGPHDIRELINFVEKCKKSFVTVSGGAEPLYRLDENRDHLYRTLDVISGLGYKTRIITREVDAAVSLGDRADMYSISLDAEVLQKVEQRRDELARMNVEYSLVLPPLPTEELVKLKPQYEGILRRVGKRLILRENLNSVFPVDFDALSFGHGGIAFVRKETCLGSKYLAAKECIGYDLMVDMERLHQFLKETPTVTIFGGFAKHLVAPAVHTDFGDIDLIATDPAVMEGLTDWFGYTFGKISPKDSFPEYYEGVPGRGGKPIQLVLVQSEEEVKRFVMNSQYDVDRLAIRGGEMTVGDSSTVSAIKRKTATFVRDKRDLSLFSINREAIERKHKHKLVRKGFTIHE